MHHVFVLISVACTRLKAHSLQSSIRSSTWVDSCFNPDVTKLFAMATDGGMLLVDQVVSLCDQGLHHSCRQLVNQYCIQCVSFS